MTSHQLTSLEMSPQMIHFRKKMFACSYNKLPIFPIFLVLSSIVLPSFRLEIIAGKNDKHGEGEEWFEDDECC